VSLQTLNVLRRAFRAPDQAIDFGTAFLRVAAGSGGAIIERRSALPPAPPASRGQRPPAAHPALQRGVISDVDTAMAVLEPVMRLLRGRLAPPRVLACVPRDASPQERERLTEAARAAGAGEIALVAEPVASAVGAGIKTDGAHAQLLVDIGDGVTDLAVLRGGQMIVSRSLRVACGDLRAALVAHVRDRYEVEVDLEQADDLMSASARLRRDAAGQAHATGWMAGTNRPAKLLLTWDELLRATEDVEDEIVGFVASSVRELPDQIAVEVIESGLVVTGGGALCSRLVSGIEARTGLQVTAARDPLRATINGARAMLSVAAKTRMWSA
jgi:rod shape-determining protein MreB and related proteins